MGNREQVSAHEPEDRAELEAFQTLDAMLALPEPLPTGLLQRTHELLEQRERSPSRPALALAGALAVVVLALLWAPWRATEDADQGIPAVVPAPTFAQQVEAALLRDSPASQLYLDQVGANALGVLHRLARGDDVEVAQAAIAQLGHLGRRESLPVLVSCLRREDRRATAVHGLGMLGDERGVEVLEPLLEDEALGGAALASVVRIGGEAAADVLAGRIRAPETMHERAALVAALGVVDGEEAALTLSRLLADPVLGSAALATLRTHEVTLLPHLLAAASRRDDREALPALDGLERLASPAAVPTLTSLLDSRRRRAIAARILARIDTRDAADALLSRASSADVREAFRRAGPGIEARLLEHLESGARRDRRRVIGLLGLCGTSAGVEKLERLAEIPALAPEAITSLGRIGGPEAAAALGRIAERPVLARYAIEALGWTRSDTAVGLLEQLAADAPSLREPTFRALARLGRPEAVAVILRLDRDRPTRRRAVRTLRSMDREVVLPALTALLEGDQAAGARRALAALDTP
jgi:hypothetical protein